MRVLNNIIKDKRVLYFSVIAGLILFCVFLNYTFSLFITGTNKISANITVGDLDYKMVINDVNLNSSVGIKDKSNSIIGDRILLSKAACTEEFDISLTSLNVFNTKYEIIYKVCSDVNCTSFIDKPEGIEVLYDNNTKAINGTIAANSSLNITIYVSNKTQNNYYIQVGLNVGFNSNVLSLHNQISNYLTSDYLTPNIKINAYVNGNEVVSFPTTSNYETSVICTYDTGETATANGVLKYTSSGWKLDMFDVSSSPTYCRIDFLETRNITYDLLSTGYKCANNENTTSEMVITYTGNCSIHADTDSNNWYMKLLSSGTLTVHGKLWLDVFIVGGGAGGKVGDYQVGGGGGGGGKTFTSKNNQFTSVTTYPVIIGAGGQGGNHYSNISPTAGGTSSIKVLTGTLSGAGGAVGGGGAGGAGWGSTTVPGNAGPDGVRAFGDTSSNDEYLYGAGGGGGGSSAMGSNLWPGTGGAGGKTGAGAGSIGGVPEQSSGGDAASASVANVGAGGGGGGAPYGKSGSGTSGVVIIRNTR